MTRTAWESESRTAPDRHTAPRPKARRPPGRWLAYERFSAAPPGSSADLEKAKVMNTGIIQSGCPMEVQSSRSGWVVYGRPRQDDPGMIEWFLEEVSATVLECHWRHFANHAPLHNGVVIH